MSKMDDIKANMQKLKGIAQKSKDDAKLAEAVNQSSEKMAAAYKKAQTALKEVDD